MEKHPPRSQTQKDQEALNAQLGAIEEATVKHTALMETRRRQLALLLHEVEHLKKVRCVGLCACVGRGMLSRWELSIVGCVAL